MKFIDQYLILRQLRSELIEKYGTKQFNKVGKNDFSFGSENVFYSHSKTIVKFGTQQFSHLTFFTETEQIYYSVATQELIVSFNNHTEFKTIDYNKVDKDVIFQYCSLIDDFEDIFEVVQYCVDMYNKTNDYSYLGMYDFHLIPTVFNELTTEIRRCIDNS